MSVITETLVGTINDVTAATHTFSSVTIPAGRLAIIRLVIGSSAVVTVNNPTDSAGNTWAVATQPARAGDNMKIAVCYSVITNALSAGTVTINFSATATCGAALAHFNSDTGWLAQASVLDKTQSGTNENTTPWSSGATATTAQADELLVGLGAHFNFNGSLSTPDSPWAEESDAIFSNANGCGMTTVWRAVTSTGAYTASGVWAAAEFSLSAIATFKTAAGVGTPSPIPIREEASKMFGPF